jgi:hypothetical protein
MGRFSSPGAEETSVWGRVPRSMASDDRLTKQGGELAP